MISIDLLSTDLRDFVRIGGSRPRVRPVSSPQHSVYIHYYPNSRGNTSACYVSLDAFIARLRSDGVSFSLDDMCNVKSYVTSYCSVLRDSGGSHLRVYRDFQSCFNSLLSK